MSCCQPLEGANVRVHSRTLGIAVAVVVVILGLPASAHAMSTTGGQANANSTLAHPLQVAAPPKFVGGDDAGTQSTGFTITAAPSGSNSVANVITCTGNVQHPHKSSHVPGTVNVVVTVTCTQSVPVIGIRAALYRDTVLVADSGQSNFYDVSFAQTNAAEPCHTAWYQGWMGFTVVFPPGYNPPDGSASGFGQHAYITC
jgi:hypothetical protein